MLDTIYSNHPVATFIAAWLALEMLAYVAISFGIVWRHIRFGFAWPVRAIRAARYRF